MLHAASVSEPGSAPGTLGECVRHLRRHLRVMAPSACFSDLRDRGLQLMVASRLLVAHARNFRTDEATSKHLLLAVRLCGGLWPNFVHKEGPRQAAHKNMWVRTWDEAVPGNHS